MLRSYYQSSFVKQYEKSDRLLRTETCINNTYHLDIGRRLENLPALVDRMAGTNQRYLDLPKLQWLFSVEQTPGRQSKGRQTVVDSHFRIAKLSNEESVEEPEYSDGRKLPALRVSVISWLPPLKNQRHRRRLVA